MFRAIWASLGGYWTPVGVIWPCCAFAYVKLPSDDNESQGVQSQQQCLSRHHHFNLFLLQILSKLHLIFLLLLSCAITPVMGQSAFFDCKRVEKNYVEEYEMQLTLASKTQKAKMFLDGRDLDQSDAFGKQEVKSIVLAKPNIFIAIEASFAPEDIMGVTYPAGTVSTQITLDPVTGKLKKIEKIQGGILGASLGNGTHVSEESCLTAKIPFKP